MNFRLNIEDLQKPENVKKLIDAISEIAEKVDVSVVTTAPNTNTDSRKGKIVLYDNSGSFETWINTDGAKAWSRIDPGAGITKITDADDNTGMEVERTSDDNIVYIKTAGTDRWIMTAAGERTMPTQPAFLVKPASDQDNILADGSDVTIIFGTEIFDQGGDFATNTFTAPVTGKYLLTLNISLEELDTAASIYSIRIITSNRTYTESIAPGQFAADVSNYGLQIAVVADMDANDTAIGAFTQSSGTAQTDINTNSSFSGALLL